MILLSVWGVATVIKALIALRTDRPYTFSMWDGGFLRAGKSITRRGAQMRFVIGLAFIVACTTWLVGLMPTEVGFSVFAMLAMVSIVASFAHEQPPQPAR
ncbi:MAG TPA: hypothetical protein VFP84_16600 [Kofleriaceae bacterium]|nr:hypothetical protein [Kofleriaceae bacterium]